MAEFSTELEKIVLEVALGGSADVTWGEEAILFICNQDILKVVRNEHSFLKEMNVFPEVYFSLFNEKPVLSYDNKFY